MCRQCKHPTCGEVCRRLKKPRKRTPLKRSTKRIAPCSKKQAQEIRKYGPLRVAFLLENPWCCVIGCGKPATDVHHARGRGIYLLVVKFFKPMCRHHHDYYETHPKEAKEEGYSESRLKKQS